MGLWARFLNSVIRAAVHWHPQGKRPEALWANLWPASPMGWPGGWSGDRWQQVLHYKQWVYIAVRAIASNVAMLRPRVALVETRDRDRAINEATRAARRKALATPQEHEQLEPVGPEHPLVRLFNDPNEPDTAFDLWYELAMFLELTGTGYLWAYPNGLGLPAELWVIPSHWLRISKPGKQRMVESYQLMPYGTAGGAGGFEIPADQVIAIRRKNPLTKIDGFGHLQGGAEWIDTGESITASRWSSFKQGTYPGLHYKLPPGVQPDDDELDRLYAKFLARFQGERNTGRPIITTDGAELNRLSLTPMEMDYSASADQIRDQILALFGVPKGIVGIEPAGDQISAYAPLRQFCRFTLAPLLCQLGQVLTEKLARRYDPRLRVWWDDPTPDDPRQLNEDLRTDWSMGALTPNEVRALRGRGPFEHGGDDPLMPAGMQPRPWATGSGPEPSGASRIALPGEQGR